MPKSSLVLLAIPTTEESGHSKSRPPKPTYKIPSTLTIQHFALEISENFQHLNFLNYVQSDQLN
jgi:hypothetical protein